MLNFRPPFLKPRFAVESQTAEYMVFNALMLCILTTVVLSLFLNRLQIQETSGSAPTRRIQDLVTLLKQADDKRGALESEVLSLRKNLIALEKNKGSVTGNVSNDPELQKLYRLAGLSATRGPGIVIRLEDRKTQSPSDEAHSDPNLGKLQADDLLKLVNELKAAGATALAINDQRLVLTSEIVAAGPTISINQTRLSQPIVVKALGDHNLLISALKIRGGILEYLNFFEIKVTVETQKDISLPAYRGTLPEGQ